MKKNLNQLVTVQSSSLGGTSSASPACEDYWTRGARPSQRFGEAEQLQRLIQKLPRATSLLALHWGMKSLFLSLLSFSILFSSFFCSLLAEEKTRIYTLEDFLKSGINHNPDVEQARAVIKDAKGNEFVFWSSILPQLNANFTTPPALLHVAITQKLYDYGTPAFYRATQYGIAAAKTNYELSINEALFFIRQAYAFALYQQKAALIKEAYADELEKSLKTVDLQFDAGKITKNEVQRLHVRASLARNDAEAQKILEVQYKNDLYRLSGLRPPQEITLQETESYILPEIMDPEKLIPIAFEQRRDLAALQNIKLANTEEIRVIRANSLPRFNTNIGSDTKLGGLGVRTGYRATYIDRFKESDDKNSDFGSSLRIDGVVSWRICDGGLTKGLVKDAQSQVIAQEVLLQRIRTDIPSQVKASIRLIEIANQNWKELSTFDPQKALDASEEDFSSGKTKQLDLLDTQERVLSQRILKINAESQFSIGKANLDRATGLGIRFIDDPSIIRK